MVIMFLLVLNFDLMSMLLGMMGYVLNEMMDLFEIEGVAMGLIGAAFFILLNRNCERLTNQGIYFWLITD